MAYHTSHIHTLVLLFTLMLHVSGEKGIILKGVIPISLTCKLHDNRTKARSSQISQVCVAFQNTKPLDLQQRNAKNKQSKYQVSKASD